MKEFRATLEEGVKCLEVASTHPRTRPIRTQAARFFRFENLQYMRRYADFLDRLQGDVTRLRKSRAPDELDMALNLAQAILDCSPYRLAASDRLGLGENDADLPSGWYELETKKAREALELLAKMSEVKSRKRRGRPSPPPEEIKRDAELTEAWDRAHEQEPNLTFRRYGARIGRDADEIRTIVGRSRKRTGRQGCATE